MVVNDPGFAPISKAFADNDAPTLAAIFAPKPSVPEV
jgi:hypothetical protein